MCTLFKFQARNIHIEYVIAPLLTETSEGKLIDVTGKMTKEERQRGTKSVNE